MREEASAAVHVANWNFGTKTAGTHEQQINMIEDWIVKLVKLNSMLRKRENL